MKITEKESQAFSVICNVLVVYVEEKKPHHQQQQSFGSLQPIP